MFLCISSVCSDFSDTLGSDQKVISFSLFGVDGPKYKLEDLIDNHNDLPKFYPGYVMRVYHDRSNVSALCDLFCQSDHLDLCFAGDIGKREKQSI